MVRDVQFLSFRPMMGYGTTEIRCVQPTRYLQSAGITAGADHILAAPVRRCRLMVLHRVRHDDLTQRIVSFARRRGTKLVYDTDDLISDGFAPEQFAPEIRRAMQLVDMVTVSGTYLQTKVGQFHDNCRIVRNRLSQRFLDKGAIAITRGRGDCGKVTIGYLSGSRHHDGDFAMIAPQLIDVLNRHADAELVISGISEIDRALKAFGSRVRIEPFRPYADFPELLSGIDINLCPLDLTSELAKARSELKFIEAAAFGIPTVASPSEAYREAIKDGETGFVSQSNGWSKVLCTLLGDADLRRSVGKRARAHVEKNYGPDCGLADWQDVLANLCPKPTSMTWGPMDIVDAASLQTRTLIRRGRIALKRRIRRPTSETPAKLEVV